MSANNVYSVIVGQRIAVIASCAGFWYLLLHKPGPGVILYTAMGILVSLACVEKLCSITNIVAIERDWVCAVVLPPLRN